MRPQKSLEFSVAPKTRAYREIRALRDHRSNDKQTSCAAAMSASMTRRSEPNAAAGPTRKWVNALFHGTLFFRY
jgi:hypothetical protein